MRKFSRIAITFTMAMSMLMSSGVSSFDSLANEYEVASETDANSDVSDDADIQTAGDEFTDDAIFEGELQSNVDDVTATEVDDSGIIEDEAAMIEAAKAETEEVISYSVHQQSYGDVPTCHNGDVAGNINTGKRLEAFVINRDSASTSELEGSIQYRAHCQSHGWMDWKTDGEVAGTSGQSKRLEAIQIQLTGELAETYDIYYKVYMSNCGWMDWTKNGEIAGTIGYASVIEGIQVLLVKKGSEYSPVMGRNASITPESLNTITYSGHVQTYGDLTPVSNGACLGTTGQSKRLEAIKISLSHSLDNIYGTVKYKVHCQNYGWMNEVSENNIAGTRGESKRLEAVSITLSGDVAKYCNVYYRVHCQKFGWMGWAKNGENAGTSGYSYRMEAIEIKILPKGSAAPSSKASAFSARTGDEALSGYRLLEPYLDEIIAKCTNSSMTASQKLRAVYDYVGKNYSYRTLPDSHPDNFTWDQYYAYQTATSGSGNCYGINSLFGHLARKVGYPQAKIVKGYVGTRRQPHGWVEIDGLVYDAELEYANNINLFGVTHTNPYRYSEN